MKKKEFVSVEEARRRRSDSERRVRVQLLGHKEVTNELLVSIGMDISVARRTLVDMTERGILTCRIAKTQDRTHYYSLAPERILTKRWVNTDNGVRLGMHWGQI